ncbi:MAG TPA: DUF1223 domain-containing protein [Verrucomicrobiae bacterium]|nr:DUF1223 domain-containing protein [Verrucomicrobiae bacterium]
MKPPTPPQVTATCLCLIFLARLTAQSAPLEFQSSQHQTALLELYTSEGCSSCPPAEAWLSKLKNSPRLWAEFVPVAFHVDYWNNLGWKDKFSGAQYTERQRGYAQLWSATDIYTPEFVLNGKEWHDWFGFRGAPSFAPSQPGILLVRSDDGKHWHATFSPSQNDNSHYEVTAAVLVSNVASDVSAGENEGRHLNHDFATISVITRPLASQTNGFQGKFIIDPEPKAVAGRVALAVWVTHEGRLEPVQATGGWLPKPQQTP